MMKSALVNIEQLQSGAGNEIGVSDWHTIGQDRISGFADVTEDHQFIHVDVEKAAASPFGGTIAHGFLVLSLLSVMFEEAVGHVDGVKMSMNYGFDLVRFLAPVKSGARVRARFTIKDIAERRSGQWRLVLDTTVEIEGEEKPAIAADWTVLLFT